MSKSYLPGGNIKPSRFVKFDSTTTGGVILQATDGSGSAGDRVAGVSQMGTQQPPMSGLDNTYAGTAGINEIAVYTAPDVCELEIGAAVNFGDLLKSDSVGRGITASTDGDNYGAIALQSGTAAGQLIRAEVRIGMRG